VLFKTQFYNLDVKSAKIKALRYVKPYRSIPYEYDKDIVVVQLERGIDFDNRYTSPICLPPKSNTFIFDAGSCVAVGFGKVDEGNGN